MALENCGNYFLLLCGHPDCAVDRVMLSRDGNSREFLFLDREWNFPGPIRVPNCGTISGPIPTIWPVIYI